MATENTMKAVRLHAYGGPEVLRYEEVPRPVPGPGEVLVRVHAAGVNPPDWYVRSGFTTIPAERRPDWPLPLTLGTDVSGVVAELGGPDTGWNVGDEVFGLLGFPGRPSGYAEYVVASAADLARKPAALGHVEAAAVPMAGLTAFQFLYKRLGYAGGGSAVVVGAAGGIGHLAVQLLRLAGAEEVVAVASGRHEEFLHGLGADRFVDYTRTPAAEAVQGADLLVDTVGGPEAHRLLGALRRGGRLVSCFLGDYRPERAAELGVALNEGLWQVRSSGGDLAELALLLADGRVRVAVDGVYPLREAVAAHRRAERGHIQGKIVLRVVG
ncbi:MULTISPECIES: NADP-dependent oxidoreductase [unclassified Kitasatospora]|uniref:NADP-dependent oxidoreductase n=1 Tax=unclassified Kitasatospora TaxID=2633591 RepID=UPI0007C7C3BD|nr:NADP-dependent oxidoreductase [Kitasatospora sp. MY 5-36]